MARLPSPFDASTVDPNPARETFPAGDYLVQIIKSDDQLNKAGTGSFILLEMDILEGEFAGRKIFDRLNVVNANQTAVDIANRSLSQICHAVGRLQIGETEEVHFIPLTVRLKVKPPGPDKQGVYRDAQNEVVVYLDAQAEKAPAHPQRPAAVPGAGAYASPRPPAAPAANSGAPATAPWKRPAA